MHLCSDKDNDCYPTCDFCKHYDFDNRKCNKHNSSKEPDDGCDDFHCFKLNKTKMKHTRTKAPKNTASVRNAVTGKVITLKKKP